MSLRVTRYNTRNTRYCSLTTSTFGPFFLQESMTLPTKDACAGAQKSSSLWKSRKVRRGIAAFLASTKESSEALADYPPAIMSCADGLGAQETGGPAAEPREHHQGESPPAEHDIEPSNPSDVAVSGSPTVVDAGDSSVPNLAVPSIPLFIDGGYPPSRTFSLFGLPVPNSPPPLKRRKKGCKPPPSEDVYVRTGAARSLQAIFDREAKEPEAARRRAPEATDETAAGSDVSSNDTAAEVQTTTASSVSETGVRCLMESSKRPGIIAAGIERDAWDVVSQTAQDAAQGNFAHQDLPRLESQADATVERNAPESSAEETSARAFPILLRTPDAETRAWAAASASALELSQPRAARFLGSPMAATMRPLSKRKLRLDESKSHKSRLYSPYAASGSTPSSCLRKMR